MILEEKILKLPKTVVTYFLRPLANIFRSKHISWVGNEARLCDQVMPKRKEAIFEKHLPHGASSFAEFLGLI